MRDGWRLAVGTFLAVRVSPPSRVDRSVAGRAMLLAPLTALPAALVWVGLGLLVVQDRLPAGVGAVLAVILVAMMSRAMHLDGLADLADALTSGYDRERALEIMKRGNTGPAGAAAIALTLLLQVACLASLFTTRAGAVLAGLALLSSRLAPAVVVRPAVPAARPSGLGQAVAGTVSPVATTAATAVVAALGVGALALLDTSPYAAVPVPLLAAAGAWLVSRRATARLGGMTGDVVGAAVEIALAVALVTASVALAALSR